ncbi:hypothetical protein HK100_006439 [Physocladia obscura]|uniref:Uncharacterized protein n=1 Tax=Physocladia obscura TaxID=109957 RepID=A0AAD5ST68_9FUNG|nr:hypothetical protein HK100_006439 [Physocladia obscura]
MSIVSIFAQISWQSYVIIPSVLLVVMFAALIVFAIMVLRYETFLIGIPWSYKSLATTFNISLLVMILSTMILYIVNIILYTCILQIYTTVASCPTFEDTVKYTGMSQILCYTAYEIAYLNYTYKRTIAMMKRSFPKLSAWLKRIMPFVPFLIGIQIIPDFCLDNMVTTSTSPETIQIVESITFAALGLTGVITISLDVVFLATFIVQVRKTHSDGDRAEEKFMVIATHGIGIVTVSFFVFAAYVIEWAYGIYFMQTLNSVFFGISVLILVNMKVVLYRLKMKRNDTMQAYALILPGGVCETAIDSSRTTQQTAFG